MEIWTTLAMQAVALAFAVTGGMFLAFSDFIMRALGATPGAGGLAAMQEINRAVFRWVFMTLFLGLVPVSLLLLGLGLWAVGGTPGGLMAVAGLVYLAGVFGVTAARNVPMNTALDRFAAQSAEGAAYWRETYLPKWTGWNSVRAVASILSSGLMLAAGAALSAG
ncbi:anthrone oxygenase family protein [Ovoidimarina sediminis]|uniref:anthrone oxygenase family protein n=1 Tax=Ovoidimarina sediminis TaxID=3079856 RepID=UPI0029151C0F|nr:anthrone oxygenase family protein [Rhodophyticola sp. MJ-SS7]MDU8946214.1 anthrone oxygenase family protein [Rhodophyticola sp. MJ-SS7]